MRARQHADALCVRRTRETIVGESGFGLIEVVISAFLLITVTFGTLSLIDQSAKVQDKNRNRSVAATLAEKDQEALRTYAARKLADPGSGNAGYAPLPRDVTVGTATYTVTSRAEWIKDQTGAPPTCENNEGTAEYLRLTSTVEGTTAAASEPIRIVSYYAPKTAAFGKRTGTLVVKALDRTGVAGVRNVPTSTLPGSPQASSQVTNTAGCAVYKYMPVGTAPANVYTVQWGNAALGFVDINGNRTPTRTTSVTDGAVVTVDKLYDRAGSFDMSPGVPAGSVAVSTPPSTYGYTIANGTNNITRYFPATRPATGSPLTTLVDADDLFPFVDGYSYYSGRCATNSPSLYGAPVQTTPLAAGSINQSKVAAQPVMRVLYQKSGVTQKNVTMRFVATGAAYTGVSPNVTCTTYDKFIFDGKTDANGYVALALPYGPYNLCVDDRASGNNKVTLTANNILNNVAAGSTRTMNITSGSKSAGCT